MHVISLYLLLYTCVATFDVMYVKKTEATNQGLIYRPDDAICCPFVSVKFILVVPNKGPN
jgi:hypothetical protein